MKVLVTGASSGIGRAVALRLARDSHDVAVGHRGSRSVEPLLAELRAHGARAVDCVGDLGAAGEPERVVAHAASSLGGLDAVVSNAGIIRGGSLLGLSVEDYDATFDVNTRATWLLARAANPWLTRSRGAFVAISSLAAKEPLPALGAYSASKAALSMMIRLLALEWAPAGVRAATVSPGMIMTPLSPAAHDPVLRGERAGRVPLGRLGTPDDIAGAVAFLLGADAGYVTGADLVVDGGVGDIVMPHATGLHD